MKEEVYPLTFWQRLRTLALWCGKKLGIDARVASGIMSRLVTMAAGPVTSLIIVWKLTVEMQGLFYLFGSLLAMRIFFDLGAGTSVIQVAAHARHLQEGDRDSKLEVPFVMTVNRLFARLALAYSIITLGAGAWFLYFKGHGDLPTLSAWGLFLIVSGLQFASEGRWGLLGGADMMPQVNRLRIVNLLAQYLVQWTLLLLGAGLYSFCIGALVGYVVQEVNFRRQHSWLYYKIEGPSDRDASHFSKELKQLIKRSSQTYLTGYFVFQIQQPICFHLLGADASAKLGLTQSIGGALLGMPGVWLAMNFPKLAHQVADGLVAEARTFFIEKWKQVALYSVFGFGLAWLTIWFLGHWQRFEERLLSLPQASVLFCALTVQGIALAATYWPRSFKMEPFVKVAYAQMIATPLLLWCFTTWFGLIGTTAALLCSWLIGAIGIQSVVRPFLHRT